MDRYYLYVYVRTSILEVFSWCIWNFLMTAASQDGSSAVGRYCGGNEARLSVTLFQYWTLWSLQSISTLCTLQSILLVRQCSLCVYHCALYEFSKSFRYAAELLFHYFRFFFREWKIHHYLTSGWIFIEFEWNYWW